MKKFEMTVNNNEVRKELKVFINNLINEINKYCNDKDYVVMTNARKLLNIEAKKVLKHIDSEEILFIELATEAQLLFEKFESFAEENNKMLQLVSIINDTCLYNIDNEIHEMLLENIIEQCQMRILTGKEYQKYLVCKVKKIKEM